MILRERFKAVRESQKMSLSAYGVALSVSKDKVYSIEKGRQKVPGDLLEKIVVLFTVNANWLLTGQGEMYPSANKLQETPHEYHVKPLQAELKKNQRQARLESFLDEWFTTHDADEQAWLEIQIKNHIPAYKDFLSNPENVSVLQKKQAGK